MTQESISSISNQIIEYLTDNDTLRKPRFKGSSNPLAGHCYVATEALYTYLGGSESSYTPQYVKHEGTTHWFLKHDTTNLTLDLHIITVQGVVFKILLQLDVKQSWIISIREVKCARDI